jgi:hypothetical protein
LVIVRAASSDFQYDRVSIGSILQVVTVRGTGLESCTVPYALNEWLDPRAQLAGGPPVNRDRG